MGHFFFTPPVQSLEYRISFIEAEGREIYLCTSIYLKKKNKKTRKCCGLEGLNIPAAESSCGPNRSSR